MWRANNRIQAPAASVTRVAGHPERRPAEDGGRGPQLMRIPLDCSDAGPRSRINT